ncbi:MAG: aspartate/glutamate racemase family protein [Candidatus Puniceispirillaceae bacterium]
MKTLGIIGGMSWESTTLYYQLLNQGMRQRKGGLSSLELILYSFDFARIEALQASGDWHQATTEMIKAGKALASSGVDGLMIATNTMHKMADEVQQATNLPLYHIADATAQAILQAKVKAPLLLATNFTMTQDFYKGRLKDNHNITVVTPDQTDRTIIHDVIYHELCQGVISQSSKQSYLDIITKMYEKGMIDSVIFGCTEIGLLLQAHDVSIPAFDTTAIHCDYVLDQMHF